MFAFYVVTDAVKWRLKVMQIESPKRESDDLTNSFEARKRVCCLYLSLPINSKCMTKVAIIKTQVYIFKQGIL